MHPPFRRRRAAALAVALVLGGCAVVDPDRQLAPARDIAARHFQSGLNWLATDEARRQAQAELDRLLAAPLAVDDAVRIALASSPSMQALLSDRIADSAAAAQSARLPNPVFAFERLLQSGDGRRDFEIDRSLSVSLLDLVLLPARLRQADAALSATRLRAADDVLSLAIATRRAWVDAVAAAQVARYAGQVEDAAAAGAELAGRMKAGGNYSRLQQAREQVFAADATTEATRARLAAVRAREALVRRLGLSPERAARLQLPDRLPDLPAGIPPEATVAQQAIDQRLDVQLAKAELDRVARAQGLVRATRAVNGFDLNVARNSLGGQPAQRGYGLALPLPLFDAGDARSAGAQAAYLAALNRTAQVGIDAASQVREAHAAYRAAYALARHQRDDVVPLRKAIADENLLRYNGMLVGVFELLADAREQVASVSLALQAERDFWRADAALQASLLGDAARP